MAEAIKSLLAGLRSWGSRQRPKIFISYRRRGEGAGYGGRIADKLVQHFGSEQCFRDVDDIESGVDFVKTIQEAVGTCEVLIAVIGPDWLTQSDNHGRRRLDDRRDFVRLEVAAALERDIRVIPVLVGGADIPSEQELPDVLKSLSRRQAHELTDTRWEYDVTKLLGSIESIGIKPRSRSKRAEPIALRWKVTAGASAAGSLVLAAVLINGSLLNQVPQESRSAPAADAKGAQGAYVTPIGKNTTQQMALALEADRTARQNAERLADEARRNKRDREDELERLRKERDVAARTVEWTKAGTEPRQTPEDTFVGTQGRVRVSWEHEGVVYTAVVVTNGEKGMAVVTYLDPTTGIQVGAEEDLDLLRNADGAFYVGANPRVPGTTIPHPFYKRDIFKLARMGNGNWTISEVGDNWQHFDRAATTP